MNTAILLQPLFAAFTAWITISLAIYLLFRPREPKRFLGLTVQGVLPKEYEQLAQKLGAAVSSGLDLDTLSGRMKDPALLAGLMPGIETHIDAFLQHRLKEKIPVLAMFLSDSILQTVRTGLIEEIEALLPQVISQYADALGEQIDVAAIIRKKLGAFSPEMLEHVLLAGIRRKLRLIRLMAAVLGFLIGLIQMGLSAWL
jgi:uncharacterized membrane protein YheB (UPF0754 family)